MVVISARDDDVRLGWRKHKKYIFFLHINMLVVDRVRGVSAAKSVFIAFEVDLKVRIWVIEIHWNIPLSGYFSTGNTFMDTLMMMNEPPYNHLIDWSINGL